MEFSVGIKISESDPYRQPTGTLLMVEPGTILRGRSIDSNDADISQATTLILDGQQRLTSLWHGLMNAGDRRYYIRVNDIAEMDLGVCDLVSHPSKHQNYETVEKQVCADVIPVDTLYDPPDHPQTEASRLESWCEQARPDDAQAAGHLRRAIEQRLRKPMVEYLIWYATFAGNGGAPSREDFCRDQQLISQSQSV